MITRKRANPDYAALNGLKFRRLHSAVENDENISPSFQVRLYNIYFKTKVKIYLFRNVMA